MLMIILVIILLLEAFQTYLVWKISKTGNVCVIGKRSKELEEFKLVDDVEITVSEKGKNGF